MAIWRSLGSWLSWFPWYRRQARDADLARELRDHLELEADEQRAAGLSREEAAYAAHRALGNTLKIEEDVRTTWGFQWLETCVQDVRYGFRTLRKSPGFTAVAVLTLALGIGGNTAIFSVIHGVLLEPLPFKDPARLYTLWERNLKMGYEQNPPAAANFRDWRDHNTVFEQMAIFDTSRTFNLAGSSTPERVDGAAVSPGLFEMLGVAPALGRTFSSDEDELGRDRVVILSYGLWQLLFNADRSIVSKTVSIEGQACTVIGVMPPGFEFPGNTGTILNIFTAPAAQLWVPLALTPGDWSQRSSHYLQVLARLKRGVTLSQAQAEMNSIEQQLVKEHPRDYIGSDVKLVSLHTQVVGSYRAALLVLFGAVLFVLLIACANVANLLLARAASRHREVAIRSAMGASRPRLVRQLLTESLMLGIAGGALGVLLADWGVSLLKLILPADFPNVTSIRIDGQVLMFTIIAAVASGLVFGLAPAFQASRTNLAESLKEGERGAEGFHRNRLRSLLVVSEIALALVLLTGTGLMLRSFVRLQEVDPGFSPEHVLTMEISLPDVRYPDPQKASLFSNLLERVHALPGVESAGAIGHLPLAGDIESYLMEVEGQAPLPNEYANPDVHLVEPGYFEAMKIPLRRGRLFDERDGADSPHALIINEVVSRNVFHNENPIGKRLQMGINNFTGEIVGVVGNTRHLKLDLPPVEEVYLSYPQAPIRGTMALTIRTTAPPLSLAQTVRQIVMGMDKELPVSKIRTMGEVIEASVAAPRFRTLLLGLFGLAALFLGTLGIYGVMSYSVSQQTHEIGVRLALGGDRSDIFTLVVGQGLKLTFIGIAAGIVGALGMTRFLSSLLYSVKSEDPTTFAAVAVLVTLVAFAACYIPARRATRVDPMISLRYE